MLDLLNGDEIQQFSKGEIQHLVIGQANLQSVPDVPLGADWPVVSFFP